MKTTDDLTQALLSVSESEIESVLKAHNHAIIDPDRPFAAYMRTHIREKGLLQQEVFLAADISEGYGYKLIAEEKHTRSRDTILRLCIAAHFSLEEVQRALKLYGLSPLYPRIPRDAVIMVAVNRELWDIHDVNALLDQHGFAALSNISGE